MQIRKIHAAFFSPCGSTKALVLQAAAEIAAAFRGCPQEEYDFTLPQIRQEPERAPRPAADELLVIGLPTYAGRLPNLVAPFVRKAFQGSGGPAVFLTTYGNRNYDDSLIELRNVLVENSFWPAAGAAVCAAHVFSDLLGKGRPDDRDIAALRRWSREAAALLNKTESAGFAGLTPVEVPGRDPVGPYYQIPGFDQNQRRAFLKAKPFTTPSCIHCGLCARVCPTGAIDPGDPAKVSGRCMKCCACIHACPKSAKRFDDPAFLAHKQALERDFASVRGKSEFFLSCG